MSNAEWVVNRSGESSVRKSAIVSVTKDLLRSNQISERLLSNTPYTVLMPPSSDHWLQGVILVGNVGVEIESISKSPNTVFVFHTPEDKINSFIHHTLSLTDNTPVLSGQDILSNSYEDSEKNIGTGITDLKTSGIVSGNSISYLFIPEELRKMVKLEKKYSLKAILIDIEPKTHEKFIEDRRKNTQGQENLLFNGVLLATALTPVK